MSHRASCCMLSLVLCTSDCYCSCWFLLLLFNSLVLFFSFGMRKNRLYAIHQLNDNDNHKLNISCARVLCHQCWPLNTIRPYSLLFCCCPVRFVRSLRLGALVLTNSINSGDEANTIKTSCVLCSFTSSHLALSHILRSGFFLRHCSALIHSFGIQYKRLCIVFFKHWTRDSHQQ